MQTSITLSELGLALIFILILIIGGYLLVTLKNLNGFIHELRKTLQKNRDHVNRIIPNIDEVSQNALEISNDLKVRVHQTGESIETISLGTAETVLTINETVNYLTKQIISISEMAGTILNVFSTDKK